jgi:hypothetical protein
MMVKEEIPSLPVSIDEMNATFDALVKIVEISSSGDADSDDPMLASDESLKLLLVVKETYRKFSSAIDKTHVSLAEKHKQRQRQIRTLAALKFERQDLERQIRSTNAFGTPHLIRVAREEIQLTSDQITMSDEQVLSKYFEKEDWNEEKQRISSLTRIHQLINSRGGLDRDLKLRQNELTEIKNQLNTKRQILDRTLPEQVAAIERASMPLQKLFPLPKTSSERLARFELAQKLSPPLYTLFQQLQLYIDFTKEASKEDVSENDETVSVTVTQSDQDPASDQVVLHLPIAIESSSKRTKGVTIHFQLDGQQVTAHMEGNTVAVVSEQWVLHELFPGDVASEAASTANRRAYHWCNYMAGLFAVGTPPSILSTRNIFKQLRQRIQSSATLKYILTSLQNRRQVPSIPGDSEADNPSVKIVAFGLTKSENTDDPLVSWTCQLARANVKRSFLVNINMACYPVIPPVWVLQRHQGEHTYSDKMAALEGIVNESLLSELLSQQNDAITCDWILAVQLNEIVKSWDEMIDTENGSRKRRHKDVS